MKINKKINKIFWVCVLLAALSVLAVSVLESFFSKNNSRYYKQGLSFEAKKDYQNAYYNFSSVNKGNEFYCPSKYRAALAAENLYDKNSAIKMYKDVIDGCFGTIIEENARYNLAKLYFEQKNYKKAEAIFSNLTKAAQIEKYRIAANYFLGEILVSENPQKAKNYLMQYLETVPNGKYSKNALISADKQDMEYTSEEHYILGLAYLQNGIYKKAKEHFSYVPIERSWYYLSVCARKMGDYKQAKSILFKWFGENTQSLHENELYDAIDTYALYFASKKEGYLKAADVLVAKRLAGGDYALYKCVDFVEPKERILYYHKIADIYPKGKFASDALWNIMLSQYRRGNYRKVIELAQEHSSLYQNTVAAPRVIFFAGKALEKSGQFSKARANYMRVLSEFPDDYYAFRAKQLLDGRKTAWTVKNKRVLNLHRKNILFPINHCKFLLKDKPIVDLLLKSGDWDLLGKLFGDNEIVKSWVNYKMGNKALSIVQARNFISDLKVKPEFNDEAYKLAYPIYYGEEINKYAAEYDLDPYIVIAIIKEESHFDTDAQSSVGAGGLMQVMPGTAAFIAGKYNLNYNNALHNNVNSNIELGCAYLDYALSELSKKYLFAVAGYNGGHNAVKNWRNQLNYNDFDEFVEEIPYQETQTYIRKVFKSYWNYLNVYDKIE